MQCALTRLQRDPPLFDAGTVQACRSVEGLQSHMSSCSCSLAHQTNKCRVVLQGRTASQSADVGHVRCSPLNCDLHKLDPPPFDVPSGSSSSLESGNWCRGPCMLRRSCCMSRMTAGLPILRPSQESSLLEGSLSRALGPSPMPYFSSRLACLQARADFRTAVAMC